MTSDRQGLGIVSCSQTLYLTAMWGKGLVTCPYRTRSAGMSSYAIIRYGQVGVNWASEASPMHTGVFNRDFA